MVRGWYGDSSAIHRGQFGIGEGHAHAHAHAHAMHMHILYAAYRGELVIDEGGHYLLLTTYYLLLTTYY